MINPLTSTPTTPISYHVFDDIWKTLREDIQNIFDRYETSLATKVRTKPSETPNIVGADSTTNPSHHIISATSHFSPLFGERSAHSQFTHVGRFVHLIYQRCTK